MIKKRVSWNKGLSGEEYLSHYKNGHPKGMLNKKQSEKAKQKIGNFHRNRKRLKKHIVQQMITRRKNGWWKDYEKTKKILCETRRGRIPWNKGKPCLPQVKEAVRRSNTNPPEEIRKKIREARAKQILPIKDTTIEVKIQNFLKELGIGFFTHQYMKIEHGYQCDVLIPSMNLVIECDGDYWHKYPIGNDLDHIRTKELLKEGFKVLRLWERDIKIMNIEEFKERIK